MHTICTNRQCYRHRHKSEEGGRVSGWWGAACFMSRIPCHNLFDGAQLPHEAVFDPIIVVFALALAGVVIWKGVELL